MRRFLILRWMAGVIFCVFSAWGNAGTSINTTGYDDHTAISGFDAVAFFTEKKAVTGQPQWAMQHQGAKWLFSSEENLKLFASMPEKFMPEWGGQCAWCVSENCISSKKLNGSFDVIGGKLYLFSPGNDSAAGARQGFWNSGGGAQARIRAGDKNWLEIQQKLQDDILKQRDASNYRRTRFD